MGRGIKGITIEINGDAQKLTQALDDVGKKTRTAQSELKEVERLLKLDPGNVELIAQKQTLLAQAVEGANEKLEVLQRTEAQVQQQFANGDIGEEQYRAFRRELIRAQGELDAARQSQEDFDNEIRNGNGDVDDASNKLGKLSEGLQKTADKLENVGEKAKAAGEALAGVSAGAVGIIGASAASAATMEKAVNKYIASTGKAVEESEKYENVLQSIYENNYGEGFEDIADKMGIVNQLMGELPDEKLQSVVEKGYLLQDVFDIDFQESIRGVNALVKQFGITSDEAFDFLVKGAQSGLNQNGDLADQMAEYAVYWSDMGMTAEEVFNALARGAENGAFQIDYLNDAMKEFGIRTKDNSDGTKGAFEALGLNSAKLTASFAEGGEAAKKSFIEVVSALGKVKNETELNTLGVALFGTKWEDLGSQAILALTEINESLLEGTTSVEAAGVMYGGVADTAQTALRKISSAGAELGKVVLPIIGEIAEKIGNTATKIGEMNQSSKTLIVSILGILAVLSPLLLLIGKLASSIHSIILLIPSITKGIGIVKGFFSSTGALAGVLSSVGSAASSAIAGISGIFTAIGSFLGISASVVTAIAGIIAAIAVLVGGFIYLWNTNEDFKNKVIEIWTNIKTFFAETINNIVGCFQSLPEKFSQVLENVKQSVMNGWNSIGTFFSETIPKTVSDIAGWFNDIPYNVGVAIGKTIGHFILMGDTIKNWVKIELPKLIDSMVNWFKELPEKVVEAVSETGNKIIKWGADLKDKGIEVAKNFVNDVVSFFKEIPQKISNSISSAADKIKDWGKSLFDTLKNAIPDFIEKVKNCIIQLPEEFKKIGQQMVEGLWSGIKSMFSWVMEKIKDFGRGIIDGMKEVLDIHSPSRVFADIGKNVVLGFGNGVSENKVKAVGEVNSMLDNANFATNRLFGIENKNILNDNKSKSTINKYDGDNLYFTVQASSIDEMNKFNKFIDDLKDQKGNQRRINRMGLAKG